MKVGDVFTTLRTSGFGVNTVEYKNLSFTVWGVGGQDKVRSLWCHVYRCANGLIRVVNDGSQVVDARDEFNKMIDDEAVVRTFANTCTPFTATRSGKKFTAVHTDYLWLTTQATTMVSPVANKVQSPTLGAGLGQAHVGCGKGCVYCKMAAGGGVPPLAQ